MLDSYSKLQRVRTLRTTRIRLETWGLPGPAIQERIEREYREELSELGLESWEINFLLHIMNSETLMQDFKNGLDETLDPCTLLVE